MYTLFINGQKGEEMITVADRWVALNWEFGGISLINVSIFSIK